MEQARSGIGLAPILRKSITLLGGTAERMDLPEPIGGGTDVAKVRKKKRKIGVYRES